MPKHRILIAEDHSLVADGLRALLGGEFEIVGVVANGLELLQAARNLRPDLVLTDVSMPLLNGLDALRGSSGTTPA